MIAVEPAPHEFHANFIFHLYGLQPFFACDAQVKKGGGSYKQSFEFDGEAWCAHLSYQESGLAPPEGGRTPTGTRWELEEMREFRLKVFAVNDPVGQRKLNAHIAPRWQCMKSKGNGADPTVPEGIEEAVNVNVEGANIPFDEYHKLIKSAAEAIGINAYYFGEYHEYSNIIDAERYVRIHCDKSGPIHARSGPIAELGHLLESERTGYRRVVQNDQNGRGEQLPGYFHTATIGPERVTLAFNEHTFPRQIKHYYAREALSFTKEHPLRHPKLGVSYARGRWDETIHLDELDELRRQLDQTIHAVLAYANVQVHQGERGPFFPDAYFPAEDRERPEEWILDLDLDTIEHNQESIVLTYLKDGFSPVQWEAFETLLTDGGTVSPQQIAEENDRHVDSVRRSIRAIEDLVERNYNEVNFKSHHIAELVYKKLKIAEEHVKDAAEASARMAQNTEERISGSKSAFMAWAAAYGIDPEDINEAKLKLRLEGFDLSLRELERFVKEGYEKWIEAGKDPIDYRTGTVWQLTDDGAPSVCRIAHLL